MFKNKKEVVVTLSELKSAQTPVEATQGASSMQELELWDFWERRDARAARGRHLRTTLNPAWCPAGTSCAMVTALRSEAAPEIKKVHFAPNYLCFSVAMAVVKCCLQLGLHWWLCQSSLSQQNVKK